MDNPRIQKRFYFIVVKRDASNFRRGCFKLL